MTGVRAQTPACSVTAAQLPHPPELQGLYLGMSADAFKARWPKLKIVRTDDLGSSALNVFPAYEPNIDRASMPDVRTISLEFLDNKLTSLWIGFDASFKWQELEEFTAGITPVLHLPITWEANQRSRQLDCADFQATISMVGQSPTIKLIDKTAQQTLEKRRAEKEASQP
ncbi:MAG TPA: hypothetical protein VM870_05880 [Pyrinomonadaceae bacterium]|nr:hypothetical protein [Pyrinomonadaceae bacterium]